jgi:hypothetical protein
MHTPTSTLAFMRIPGTWGAGLMERISKEAGREPVIVYDPPAETTAFDLGDPARFLAGCFGWGHHLKLGLPGASYVAFVREPLARLGAQLAEERAARRTRHPEDEPSSLAVRLREAGRSAWRYDNTIVRMVSGIMDEAPLGSLGPDAVERAISHAERDFLFIGQMERFDRDLSRLGSLLRWAQANETLGAEGISMGAPAPFANERELAHELNRLDAQFVGYVRRFWQEPAAGGVRRWVRRLRVWSYRQALHARAPSPARGQAAFTAP